MSAIKQSLVKTRMPKLRVQRNSFARLMFSLTDDKARYPFSVAEGVRTMTYPGGKPLDRLPGVLNNFHSWKWFEQSRQLP